MKNSHYAYLMLLIGLTMVACQNVPIIVKSKVVAKTAISNKTQVKITNIEKLIKERVEANDIPALVVGIIQENEVQAFINAGTMERGSETPVNEKTVFQLGSLSKTFTGIMANHLIEEGQLNVAASITDYLPNTLSAKAKEKLQPITVQDLLNHSSGLPRDAVYAERPYKWMDGPMVGGYDETKLLKDLEELELSFTPGTRWVYSNLGFGLMGYILERISGQPLQTLFATYFSEEYGLSRTTMDLAKAKQMGMPTPYKPSMRKMETAAWEMGYLRSGGGVCSTAEDLSILLIKQMKDYQEYQLGQQSTPLILTENKISWTSNDGYPYYGDGLMVFNKIQDSTMVHYVHGGDVDGFASVYVFFPNQQIGLVMLTSSGGPWFQQLEWAIQDILLEQESRKAITLEQENIAQFEGDYELRQDYIVTIQSSENQLIAVLPRAGEQKALAYASNKFFFEEIQGELIFENGGLRFIDNFGNHFIGEKKMGQLTTTE